MKLHAAKVAVLFQAAIFLLILLGPGFARFGELKMNEVNAGVYQTPTTASTAKPQTSPSGTPEATATETPSSPVTIGSPSACEFTTQAQAEIMQNLQAHFANEGEGDEGIIDTPIEEPEF